MDPKDSTNRKTGAPPAGGGSHLFGYPSLIQAKYFPADLPQVRRLSCTELVC